MGPGWTRTGKDDTPRAPQHWRNTNPVVGPFPRDQHTRVLILRLWRSLILWTTGHYPSSVDTRYMEMEKLRLHKTKTCWRRRRTTPAHVGSGFRAVVWTLWFGWAPGHVWVTPGLVRVGRTAPRRLATCETVTGCRRTGYSGPRTGVGVCGEPSGVCPRPQTGTRRGGRPRTALERD